MFFKKSQQVIKDAKKELEDNRRRDEVAKKREQKRQGQGK